MNIENLTRAVAREFARLAEDAINDAVDADPQDPTYNRPEDYALFIETAGQPTYTIRLRVAPVRWVALDECGDGVIKRTLKVSASLAEATEADLPEATEAALVAHREMPLAAPV